MVKKMQGGGCPLSVSRDPDLVTEPWAVRYSLCLKLIFQHTCLGCDPPPVSSAQPGARMVPIHQHYSAAGAARSPPGTRAGCGGLLLEMVPGSTKLHSEDDPASPPPCKLVLPHCPLQVSGPFSRVQFPRPFREGTPWTTCVVRGSRALLRSLSGQEQTRLSGVPRAQEQTLPPLLG